MRKERDAKTKIELPNILEEEHKEIDKFLSKINSTITEILKSEHKKYSILSLVLNCFYENKSLSLPRQTIYEYIHQDILKNKGKMIVSFVANGTNNMGIINVNNYMKKTYNILVKNKCLERGANNYISIDMNFIQTHKNLVYRNLFGICEFSKKKIKKLKRPKIKKKGEIKAKIIKKEKIDEDDFEIEILESDQEETEITVLKKDNFKSTNDKNQNNNNIADINKNPPYNPNTNIITNISKSNIINIAQKKPDVLCLNKKRKIEKTEKLINIEREKNISKKKSKFPHDVDDKVSYNKNSNLIMKKEEEEKDKIKNKEKIIAEKEIISLIDEGKLFLSLFQDKKLLDKFEKEQNNLDESDSFIKSILLKYRDENNLAIYLNVLNEEYSIFQNCLKSLLDYKSSLDDSNSNKFIGKFSVINKIILEKEKCSLLIEQIITKLKQIILEFNFIKQMLNNISSNKNELFLKVKEIMAKIDHYKEKKNYINELKNQLQEELRKILVIDKEENEKNN